MSNLTPMGLTRDSKMLWVGVAAAIFAYLGADGRPPTEWTYGDWIKAGIAATGWVLGKLQTSPLAGKED